MGKNRKFFNVCLDPLSHSIGRGRFSRVGSLLIARVENDVTTFSPKKRHFGPKDFKFYANEADTAIMAEIDSYTHICATFDASQYVDPKNDDRYDILRFWDAHKKILPVHYYLVFLGDCGSKRASSASVETVYSGKYCPLLPPDPSPMPTPSKPCLLTLGRCYQYERQGLPTGRQ